MKLIAGQVHHRWTSKSMPPKMFFAHRVTRATWPIYWHGGQVCQDQNVTLCDTGGQFWENKPVPCGQKEIWEQCFIWICHEKRMPLCYNMASTSCKESPHSTSLAKGGVGVAMIINPNNRSKKIITLNRSWGLFWPQHKSWGHIWPNHISPFRNFVATGDNDALCFYGVEKDPRTCY